MLGLLAQTYEANDPTNELLGPLFLFTYAVMVGISIFCAYLTARNQRWVLFVLGFCLPILWVVGALIGRPSSGGGFSGYGNHRSYRGNFRR